ncbi:MAG TPA: cytochrome c peroxidase, partial [Polyangiaceae bacterium]
QPLDVGLRGSAPFHWDGSLADMSALMGEVFSRRMGGSLQSAARVQAIDDFVATFRPPAPHRSPMDEAAVRGKALFESSAVGCASCHSGSRFSDNVTVDIGRGDSPTQTPSLLGVAYRAPFMHDGCAATLRERFEPKCGGTEHGNVENLSPAALDDLIAYLESL